MKEFERSKEMPRTFYRERIMSEARKGTFNSYSLLSTPREVSCRVCKHSQKVVYLEYLKSGKFEFGMTTLVFYPGYQIGVLSLTEPTTPIIIKIKCGRCDSEVDHAVPINVEYLLFMTTRGQRSGYAYV